MLDSAIKDQLKGLFAQLEAHYTFDIFVHPQHESRAELVDLLEEVASCSDKLSCRLQDSEGLKFILLKKERIRESHFVPYLVVMNLLLC